MTDVGRDEAVVVVGCEKTVLLMLMETMLMLKETVLVAFGGGERSLSIVGRTA